MHYDLFFPIDNQVVCIFYPKKCLTTLSLVMCLTHGWILVQAERGQPTVFLKMVANQKRLYPGIMSHVRLENYVWVWLINKDDWSRRLGHYTLGFSLSGPISWRVWAKAHGTHKCCLSKYMYILGMDIIIF